MPCCAEATTEAARIAIASLDRAITASYSALAEQWPSGPPAVEEDGGHLYLTVRRGFRAGGRSYALTLRQIS